MRLSAEHRWWVINELVAEARVLAFEEARIARTPKAIRRNLYVGKSIIDPEQE